MNTLHNKTGFTLAEVIIAIACNAILILTVGVILMITWREWRVNSIVAQLRRDSALAAQFISQDIRESALADITTGSGILGFDDNAVRPSRHAYVQSGGSLIRAVDGLYSGTVISRGVQQFRTARSGSQVEVFLSLADAAVGLSITNHLFITVRN